MYSFGFAALQGDFPEMSWKKETDPAGPKDPLGPKSPTYTTVNYTRNQKKGLVTCKRMLPNTSNMLYKAMFYPSVSSHRRKLPKEKRVAP